MRVRVCACVERWEMAPQTRASLAGRSRGALATLALATACWSEVALRAVRAEAATSAEGVAAPTKVHAGALPRSSEWWQGHMMSMNIRRVVALSSGRVVLCYARLGGSGCRFAVVGSEAAAAGASELVDEAAAAESRSSADIGHDPRLLPALFWRPPRVFDRSAVIRVEAERLTRDSFVVCFERNGSSGVGGGSACSLGIIRAGLGGEEELAPLTDPAETDADHLVAVQVLEAGRRFGVCHRDPNGQESRLGKALLCRWGEVHRTEDASGAGVAEHSMTWAAGSPLKVVLGTNPAVAESG